MNFRLKIEYIIPIGAAILFSILALSGLSTNLEYRVMDTFQKMRPSPYENPNIVLVDMDDQTIADIGTWPISRSITANGLMLMAELGAKQATFDIEYTNKSPRGVNAEILEREIPETLDTEINVLQNQIKALFQAVASGSMSIRDAAAYVDDLVGIAEATKQKIKAAIGTISLDNDLYLAQAAHFFGDASLTLRMLKEKDTTVTDQDRNLAVSRFSLKNIDARLSNQAASADIIPVISPILDAATSIGFVNVEVDSDGVRRRVDLVQRYGDVWFGQLAFRPLLDLLGNPHLVLYPNSLVIQAAHLPNGQVKDIRIPFASDGRVLLDWPHKEYSDSFRHVSFYSLYEHDQIFDLLVSNVRLGDSSGYFHAFTGDTPLLEIARQASALKKAIMNGDESQSRIADYRALRERFLHDLGAFLKTKPADAIVADVNKILADPKTNAATKQEFQNFLTAVPEYFRQMEIAWDKIMKFRTSVDGLGGLAKLQGAFCIIGQTDTGSTDLGATPFVNKYANVGTHASLVNMILNNRFIFDVSPLFSTLIALLGGLAISFFTRNLKPSRAIMVGLAAVVGTILLVALFFILTGIYVPVLPIAAPLTLSFITVTFLKFLLTEREKGELRNAFSHYLSPDVIAQIIANPEKLRLGGDQKVMTAMFTDIKGFSTISEKMSPTELVTLLNQYLTGMSDIILEMGGTIDKYEGDAIIAFFGAPIDLADHAHRALLSAIRMKRMEAELNQRFIAEGLAPSPLLTRFGVNTGQMVVGNMGTVKKMDYTIIGDSVNLAARLEGVNKRYGTWMCISEDTVAAAGPGFVLRRLDRIRVVGKSQPIRIFELVEETDKVSEIVATMLPLFEQGMELFEQREWAAATKKFAAALKLVPDDGPSQRFIKTCKEYAVTPPPANWDGVYAMDIK